MSQSTNNRILLKTLAFCAAVAGVGAAPAMAEHDCTTGWDLFRQQQKEDFERSFEMEMFKQDIRNEMDARFESMRGY